MTAEADTLPRATPRLAWLGAALVLTSVAVVAAIAATLILDARIDHLYAFPGPWHYVLAGLDEVAVAGASLVAGWVAFLFAGRWPLAMPRLPLAALVAVTVLVALLLRLVLFQNFLLEVDEVMLSLQAEMLGRGATAVPYPDGLAPLAPSAHPYMANHDAAAGLWSVFYLPVYAALLALGNMVGSSAIVNPALAGVSVWMAWSIARHLWPEDRVAAPAAAFLLATIPQFLFPAATGFALTAHLAFNLVWLRQILAGGTRHLVLAAIVGCLAIGLHRPHVHLLFAFPFVSAWLFGWQNRRPLTAVAFGLVYFAALYVWLGWADWSIALATGDWSAVPLNPAEFKALGRYADLADLDHGRFEEARRYGLMGHNLLRLFAWMNPAVFVLFLLGFLLWRRLDWTARLLLLSALSSVLPYTYLMPNPSIGWGYRFAIPALGPMVLGGIAAWRALSGSIDTPGRVPGLVMLSTFFTLAVLFPLHGMRATTEVRANAAAQAGLEAIEADFVLLDHTSFETVHLRNALDTDNRPLFLALTYLDDAAKRTLCARPSSIVVASASAYEPLGIVDRSRRFLQRRSLYADQIADLRVHGCEIDDAALRKPSEP